MKSTGFARLVKGISPSVWPLIIAICLILLGATVAGLGIFLKLGLFIIAIYAIVWIVWTIFQAYGW